MGLKATCAIAIVLQLAAISSAHADPRADLAKEVLDEISTRHMTCTSDYPRANVCGGDGILDTCTKTMDAITDFKADLGTPDTHRQAVYRWWRYVSGDKYRANCMRALLSKPIYCKAVILLSQFDPHKNCPSGGGTNATCWVNRNWEREPLLLPREESDWYQRCEFEQTVPSDEE